MNTLRICLMAVCWLGTSLAPAGTGDPPPPTGAIRGVVVDRETGNGLPHANVLLANSTRGVITDSLGVFLFPGLPQGEHTLKVFYLGYAPAELTLTLAAAETLDVRIALAVVIVETLSAFDVDAETYMVEIKNTAAEQRIGSDTFERYAIDSVGERLVKGGGGMKHAGEIRRPPPPPPTVGAESGGRRNPNDRPYDLVYHEHTGVNPFVPTEDDALSTFALEVDDASWTIARRYLDDGHLPPSAAIRLEEIVNRLDPGLATDEQDFSIHVEGAPSRFGKGYHLLRIGVRARDVVAASRPPAHLVFVIDVSGSMERENRLGLVKKALRVLVGELQDGDQVGIVVYGSHARVVLEPTPASDAGAILRVIDGLKAGGSTNAEDGLRMAYSMARDHDRPGAMTRLILCSDGVANVGRTGPESILGWVRRATDDGISLTTVGFGMGNFNDVLMERLADDGDGTYHYVHRLADAERVFRQNLTGTLQTVGAEVKTQVEFDPEAVSLWRLLGYENRDVADKDFRNDAVDAGEIGAGHTAVALYEVKLTGRKGREGRRGRQRTLGTVRLRWAKPSHHEQAGEVTEIERPITTADLAGRWQETTPRLQTAAVAAEFAEILRGSYWARGNSLADLVEPITALVGELPGETEVVELSQMIRRAAELEVE